MGSRRFSALATREIRIAVSLALTALPVHGYSIGPSRRLQSTDFVVAGLSGGMTLDQVRNTLGPPDMVTTSRNPFDTTSDVVEWKYQDLKILSGDAETTTGLTITGKGYKTARGLVVGDRDRAVVKLYGKPVNKYKGDWDFQAPDDELHVIRVHVQDGRVTSIYLGWLLD